jgi:DNA mismatch repair protein MutS2
MFKGWDSIDYGIIDYNLIEKIMDEKTLTTLEYFKILERLATFCDFPASAELARNLRPVSDVSEARQRQAETSEALELLVTRSDLTIGGARDVRSSVDLANHGGVLEPFQLLDIKYTLMSARDLGRTFEKIGFQFPKLFEIASMLPQAPGVIDAITRAISERGEILDHASEKLASIRRDLRIVHDRLMAKLQKMVSDPRNAPYLQDALVTQRDGRYVVPLRSEFKGRIKSIVHDQSSSGATLFVEPIGVVEMNNQYRELQLAERDEERRILAELSSLAAQYGEEILQIVNILAQLDLAFAKAKYSEKLHAYEPKLTPIKVQEQLDQGVEQQPISRHPGTMIRLYQARHPLLNQDTVVPIDADLDEHTYALVVTGPNTGGKTVTLKTVGLLALMAQSGLHIPAHSGSELSVFENIYADIGDEQSIEQSLSTFSGHITNIIHILKNANQRSLVILDELGAGTDPTEGSALARALLNHLLERGITTLVTTHHPELKAYAHATPGVVNASVEFDLQTLRPTFRLTIGLPGRSNALAIAQRLGMPEGIIDEARSELSPDELRAEDLLNEIHHQRDVARQARAAAEIARKEADALRLELLERLERIEDERRKLLEETRQQATAQIDELQSELADVRKSLARARQPVEVLKEIEEKVDFLEEQVEQPVERQEPKLGPAMKKEEQTRRRAIRLGDKVRLRSLGMQGVLIALSEQEAEVQLGMMRVRARLTDIEHARVEDQTALTSKPKIARSEKISAAATPTKTTATPVSPGLELDIRGKRADEALEELDRYLDAAYLAGLLFVRIIHGKGTGKLREAVRQAVQHHACVRSFEAGSEKDGGDGVTVVKLSNS